MKRFPVLAICFVIFWGTAFSATSYALTLDGDALAMVKLLTNELGVTEKQASGGAGALFNMAKENLSASEYGAVTNKISGIDGLLQSVPNLEKKDTLSSLGSAFGKVSDTAKKADQLNTLSEQFSALDMDNNMITKFIPVVLNFVQSEGGQAVMNILKTAWNNFL